EAENSRARSSSAAATLRAAGRRRRRRSTPSRVLRWPAIKRPTRAEAGRLAGCRTRTARITAGACVTLIGGAPDRGMGPGADATGEESADGQAAEHEARRQGDDVGGPDETSESDDTGRAGDVLADESEVARVLEDLCSARARA